MLRNETYQETLFQLYGNVLTKGKGSLFSAGLKGINADRRNEGGFYGWLRYGTQNLKNYKDFHDLTLEGMFEYIINDPRTIEFQINPGKFSEYKFAKYGAEAFLEGYHKYNFSLNNNPQVIISGRGTWLSKLLSINGSGLFISQKV